MPGYDDILYDQELYDGEYLDGAGLVLGETDLTGTVIISICATGRIDGETDLTGEGRQLTLPPPVLGVRVADWLRPAS